MEYIAIDLDPVRIRAARQMGDPVVFGDSADEQVLSEVGIAKASAIVISFSDTPTALAILHSVRNLREDVPVLVRTRDDSELAALKAAGATEVIPEAFEASLMLASHVLMSLGVPASQVMNSIDEMRGGRYQMLRNVTIRDDGLAGDQGAFDEQVRSVVLPPGAWCVGRAVDDVRKAGADVAFTGIRRHGILGREPDGTTELLEGDIVVIYGTPEQLEHAEAVLLAG
jgi:monovalent cation:H+ antiporter-2, CPA2 family